MSRVDLRGTSGLCLATGQPCTAPARRASGVSEDQPGGGWGLEGRVGEGWEWKVGDAGVVTRSSWSRASWALVKTEAFPLREMGRG